MEYNASTSASQQDVASSDRELIPDREFIRAVYRHRHKIAWLLEGTPPPVSPVRDAEQAMAAIEAAWKREDASRNES